MTENRSPVEPSERPVFTGESGDGGNRTHGSVHPSPLDLIRAVALSLRDLAEGVNATAIQITLASDATLTWDEDDGFHLLTEGETLDVTEWVDHAGLIPAEGVESVTQQAELLAARGGSA